jgi:hypothetical protein
MYAGKQQANRFELMHTAIGGVRLISIERIYVETIVK